MVKRQKLLPLLQLSVATIAIMLLAAGLSELDFRPGRLLELIEAFLKLIQRFLVRILTVAPPPTGGGEISWLNILTLIFWASLFFSIIYAVISPQYRKVLLRTFLTLLTLLLVMTLLSERYQNAQPRPAAENEDTEETEFLPDPPSFITDPPGWFLLIVNVSLVLLFLGVMWFFWRFWRLRLDAQTLLAQEAEIALADLEAGGDLKDVVLRCYARMSHVLRQSRDVARGRAMTPREFEKHLAETGLRDEHIQRLTRLFESVRYGGKPSGERAEREAIDCLKAIVQAYGEAS